MRKKQTDRDREKQRPRDTEYECVCNEKESLKSSFRLEVSRSEFYFNL